MAPINIRGNEIDPQRPVGFELPPDASGTKYVLVQLNLEMTNRIASELEACEAQIIKRMTGNTWLLYYPPDDLRVLESIGAVEHALVYLNDFVVHNDLQTSSTTGFVEAQLVVVSVYLHENEQSSAASALREIQEVADVSVQSNHGGVFQLEVSSNDLQKIASIDAVQAIEAVTEAVPFNDRCREICGVNKLNLALPPDISPLTGEGQCLGMADSGLDKTQEAFQNFPNRIVKTWYVTGIDDDDKGHGTHVAGIMLGGPVICWQDQPSLGIAPSATLSVQGGLFRGQNWLATTLFDQAYNTPGVVCRIHNNSWGKGMARIHAQAPYTTADAEKVDQWALAHPDFLIIFAAGNDGEKQTPSGGQVGAWSVAKNVLTVGATFTDRPFRDDYAVDYSMVATKRARDTVSAFSSRGPVITSQRTKPDIVAPGAGVLSARASHPDAVKAQSSWPVQFGSPPDGYRIDDRTIFCSGTSMAAPVVSGCAVLLREALIKWHHISPSAPLMKALLINGADDLHQDKHVQGYGQINMEKVLCPVKQNISEIVAGTASSGYSQNTSSKRDSSVTQFAATISDQESRGKASLQITFVYHDHQGDTIQNRLSLSAECNGVVLETAKTQGSENVHRILVQNLKAGDVVSIGVMCDFLNNGTPWAVVWNQTKSSHE